MLIICSLLNPEMNCTGRWN